MIRRMFILAVGLFAGLLLAEAWLMFTDPAPPSLAYEQLFGCQTTLHCESREPGRSVSP